MLLRSLLGVASLCAQTTLAKSSWTFSDATVSIQGKTTSESSQPVKEKLSPSSPLPKAITLGARDTLKVLLSAKDGSTSKRPHQAFLTLQDPTSGLEDSFSLTVRDTGRGKVDITQKDIPIQLLTSASSLKASVVLASFGATTPLMTHAFDLSIAHDQATPLQAPPAPLRYGKLPEINHIFRDDPKSPNVLITLIFAAAVLITLPVFIIVYSEIGVNLSHVQDAFSTAPVAHGLFFGSILALEGVFLMYYIRWNLFQTLPVALGVGVLAFLSGSRALSEVQARRLAGKR